MVNELCLTKVVLKKTETPKLNPSMKLNLREQREWNAILKIKYTKIKKKELEEEEEMEEERNKWYDVITLDKDLFSHSFLSL